MMTAKEVIDHSKGFAEELITQLSNKTIPQNKRQVYFMDNHDKVQGCMKALRTVIDGVKGETSVSAEELQAMNDATAMLDALNNAIQAFQQELMIQEDVQEEDLEQVKGISTESLQQAMSDNSTTKDIMKDMNDIAKSVSPSVGYTHCLVCDGVLNMFTANTKEELNKCINDIVSVKNYTDIHLFRVSFVPVPLKKKVVLTV